MELSGAQSGWMGKTAEHCGYAKVRIIILEERWIFVPNQLNQTLKMQKVVTGGSMTPAVHAHLHIHYGENRRTLRRWRSPFEKLLKHY